MTGERDYIGLTPQKLNGEFSNLLDQMPLKLQEYDERLGHLPGVGMLDTPIGKTIGRRIKSEHLERFLQRAESLLEQAPITTSFKKQLLGDLEMQYVLGISSEELPEIKRAISASDEDGGFFSKSNSKDIERKHFREFKAIDLALDSVIDEVYGFGKSNLKADDSGDIPSWRKDFIELYGEEQ